MLSEEEKKYYDRHLKLPEFGIENQLRLKNSKVLVIGSGGLGCPVLQYLAAAGVGSIGIMDGDKIDISNLHRQILFGIDDIGKSKAEVASRKLTALNPNIQLIAISEWLTKDNALDIFSQYDLIVDCSDNFGTRYLVNDASVINGKPLVYGAISKFEGHVSVFNYMNGPTYRCLFPDHPTSKEAPNCEEIGVLGVLPGIIGSYQALECIKVLCDLGEVLSGKLLVIDTLKNRHNLFTVSVNEENKKITELGEYGWICPDLINSIDYSTFIKMQNEDSVFLLDVREAYEYDKSNIGGILIPLSEIENRIEEIPRDKHVIIMCQSGVRSLKACEILRSNEFTSISNLSGGMNAINSFVKD